MPPDRTVHEGDYYMIDLPEKLIVKNSASGQVFGNENRVIGNYSFVEESTNKWKMKVLFTEYVDDLNEFEIHGDMNFDFVLDVDAIDDGKTETIYMPIDNTSGIDLQVTKPVPPATKPSKLTKSVKSYNNLSRELVWNIKMEPESGIFSNCVFTDTLDINSLELKSIKHGSVTLVENTDYTYDNATGEIAYTIPNGRDGKNFQNIEISSIVKADVYGDFTATTINNQANLFGGKDYVDIDSNTSSYTITPDWFKKAGEQYEGNQIKWTLTTNSTRQKMLNAVITEYLQKDVKFRTDTLKLGNTSIAVYDNEHTPATDAETYAVYKENTDKSATLKIYFPRGVANASTDVQTVTFETDIASPDSGVNDGGVYTNTAEMEADYLDGDTAKNLPTATATVDGVNIPHVSVKKEAQNITADDKRNGTITWNIKAASNLSDYGKSVIVDTLPDDQTYVAGEIYLGTTPINETTEPSAVISNDGRTLTISFNSTNVALATQQIFSVKTKIDPEIYGQNLNNRNFTNKAEAFLYDLDGITVLDSNEYTGTVSITNKVIEKASSKYNLNSTKQGVNPCVNFTITINSNQMPLKNVVINDDLNAMITELRKNGETTWNAVNGVKWTYVPNTLNITDVTPTADKRDNLDLSAIKNATQAGYNSSDNVVTVDFGSDVEVNDKYTITFTAELDVAQNDAFKQNGTIRTRGNVAGIKADGLKLEVIKTPATGNQEIQNDVLNKTGVEKQAEHQIVWTIRLNQHRVELDNMRVVDILPLGLTLDPTSIKLYKNVIKSDGSFISDNEVGVGENGGTSVDFEYTCLPVTEQGMEGQYALKVNLPENKTDYILQFATDIDNSLSGKTITNSAYFAGDTNVQDNNDSASVQISGSSGGSSTTKARLTVYKKSNDTGAAVKEATFALHWLKNGTEPVFVRTLSTTDGTVAFYGLAKGEKYTVTETGAPSGYLIDNPNPVEIIIPAGNENPTDVVFTIHR